MTWLGPALAKVRLHAIDRRGETVAKRRRWYASTLIELGNLYLRWLGSGVVVLRDRAWKAREIDLHRRLHGLACTVDRDGWLILPRWPGILLADYASDPRHSPADRLEAVKAASRALEALHQFEPHGDATLRNVLFDPSTGRAAWFDFDTAHEPSMPPLDRRADDLRGLLYSALEALADLPVPAIFKAVRSGYDDPQPWQFLRERLDLGLIHFDPFHLAQARPPLDRQTALERLIRGTDRATQQV